MSHHAPYLPYMTNSLAIRQEIQRFESVHPSIYAIYDLIELVPDPLLAQQIREHVVCIEGKLKQLRLYLLKSFKSYKCALLSWEMRIMGTGGVSQCSCCEVALIIHRITLDIIGYFRMMITVNIGNFDFVTSI